jgi:hypothetical protein
MRYFHTLCIQYAMQPFESFSAVYRAMYEMDQTKWTVYGGYKTFAEVLHDVLTIYQFKGMLVEYGWFIYGVQSDGTMVKLNEDGIPIPVRACPSG